MKTSYVIFGVLALVVGFILFKNFSSLKNAISSAERKAFPIQPRPSPFGYGLPTPPIGQINYKPGPPQPPIASSLGAAVTSIQTGVSAASRLANDVKDTVQNIKNLFN
jgi:hypothetical protein